MKKSFRFTLLTLLMLLTGFVGGRPVLAYETIAGSEAYEIYLSDPNLIVVDVREDSDFCAGHVACSLNYPYNSGVFASDHENLPTGVPILVYCASGFRSDRAAALLDAAGYEEVYSLGGGISGWPSELYSCGDVDEECDSAPAYRVYYPHVASGSGWETEIGLINTDALLALNGVLQGCDAAGNVIEESPVSLPAAGRLEFTVSSRFAQAGEIKYLIFASGSSEVYGYLKFYDLPSAVSRVAIPAPNRVNENSIALSHIAASDGWWTGLALVNTGTEDRTLSFRFNNGESKNLPLAAGAYQSLVLEDFLVGLDQAAINSALIENAAGVVGLEIFGNGMQLGGVLLRDDSRTRLYYPHIANDENWWTGIAAYNPGAGAGAITLSAYDAAGNLLSPAAPATLIEAAVAATPIEIAAGGRFISSAADLDLPAATAWLALESTVPLSGFELFGSSDGRQLAGYTSVGIESSTGVFAKLEDNGWTGIALVNIGNETTQVNLEAYSDAGELIAAVSRPLAPHARLADAPENIFAGHLEGADYLIYQAVGGTLVAFQLNGSGAMLDALPAHF
ncbi:MAG: rhodanese-like domain-containing protein [Deltaproteobacteria bacterium]|nr:rhodanese-like domain-containing protein [Deltaproteobacteria bacterium]